MIADPACQLSAAESGWQDWRGRRPAPRGIHFDTAAAGRSSRATLAATAAHAEREAVAGAYVAQSEAALVLEQGRGDLAQLLGMPSGALAFVESASAARAALLSAWPLGANDTIAMLPSEWGPNMTAFAERGLRTAELPADGDGIISLPGLAEMLAARPPAIVHLTLVASHRGLVQPVAAAADLCRAAEVPVWVDAAQAIGHVDTACGADAVYATSRKWLTGPRGVGMLAIAERWWDRLQTTTNPLAREHIRAGASPVLLLESGEANVAGRVGLCTAVREYLAAGPARVNARLATVGQQTRQLLANLPGWSVAGQAGAPSAITALCPEAGQDVAAIRARLLTEHSIVTTMASTHRAPREMKRPTLRISPHVDCTLSDLATLRAALASYL
jgi:hercynylcysteine S-oxide lyase